MSEFLFDTIQILTLQIPNFYLMMSKSQVSLLPVFGRHLWTVPNIQYHLKMKRILIGPKQGSHNSRVPDIFSYFTLLQFE